ncbi:Methyltransferase domain-containing protein [Aquimarina amphilecti]|uniref:Methyltransferase domain-containing protein n=1 Tax=Aquimarina amphilecti TaxID=1038014 RepID=A0A1H7MYF6_AQUAM|nr:methyltransferase domain-containing protein [Aquimarina amphilecti]SEL16310.1 Methyltransferase domain-containing protein [Aquimarina amphilecti]
MNLRIRLHTAEQLDNLSLSGKTLSKTLSSLKLINKLFGNHKQLAKSTLDYCIKNPNKKQFRIVDIGCGGGDSLYNISNTLNAKGIEATFLGIDGNPQSIRYASSKYNHIQFKTDNILDHSFSIPDCDIIISSHFMYHFEDQELTEFIQRIREKGIKHIIFSELKRSKTAYFLFKYSSYFLPISKLAKQDGLIAIQRAFTVNELKSILDLSDVKNYTINEKFWFRTITKINL